jgi:hypothetical protein
MLSGKYLINKLQNNILLYSTYILSNTNANIGSTYDFLQPNMAYLYFFLSLLLMCYITYIVQFLHSSLYLSTIYLVAPATNELQNEWEERKMAERVLRYYVFSKLEKACIFPLCEASTSNESYNHYFRNWNWWPIRGSLFLRFLSDALSYIEVICLCRRSCRVSA